MLYFLIIYMIWYAIVSVPALYLWITLLLEKKSAFIDDRGSVRNDASITMLLLIIPISREAILLFWLYMAGTAFINNSIAKALSMLGD